MADIESETELGVTSTLAVGSFFKDAETLPTKTSGQQAAKRRRLARCETDELVHKAIRDNFKNWSHSNCFELRNAEGLTLFEKLRRDKHERRHNPKCEIRFGPGYYQGLRYEYSDLDSPGKQLVVKNTAEDGGFEERYKTFLPVKELNRMLCELLSGASKCSKKKQELVAFLATAGMPNQRTLVGLLRWMLTQRPWANDKMMAVATALMDMIMRLELCCKYPEEIAMCSDWFDLVLTSIWSKCKKAGMTASSWLSNQRQRASLVMEMTAVETVLAATQFKEVASELNTLCCGSRLGNALFGWALLPLVSERVSMVIDAQLKTWSEEGGLVTAQRLSEVHALCNDAVRKEMLTPLGAREVTVVYRGFEMKVTCATAWEEILMKTASLLKGVAADLGNLGSLFVEDELLKVAVVKTESKSSLRVHADVVSPWQAARNAATESMNKDFSSNEIVNTLTKRLPTYLGLDSTFALELSLFKALGSTPGEKALLTKMLGCLPSKAETNCDYGEALRKVTTLFEGRLYSYLPAEVQGKLRAGRDVLASVAENRCPSCVSAVPGGTVAQMLTAIERTLAEEVTTQDGQKSVLIGKAALGHRLKQLKKQDLKKSGPEILHGVAPFAWLLSATEKETLEEVRKNLIKAGSVRVNKTSGAATSSSRKKGKGDEMKATLDLFA
eukprot:2523252-Amphidinium_carterae.2